MDTLSSSLFCKEKLTMRVLNFTKIDKSCCYEAIRQKSLIVKIKFKRCVYSNKLIYSSIYIGILVAGLEALCAVRRKVQTVLFTVSQESQYCTGYPQIQVQIESE